MNGNGTGTSGNGEGTPEKDAEYFASKGRGGHNGNGAGGHARRRLEEMISQRVPARPDGEEEAEEGTSPEPASTSRADDEAEKKDEEPDRGAPDAG
jgi:hypothetical protein